MSTIRELIKSAEQQGVVMPVESDPEQWTPELEARLNRRVLEKLQTEQIQVEPERRVPVHPKQHRRLTRLLAALAVAAVVLSAGTVATATLTTSEPLLHALHADTQSQVEQVAAMTSPVEQSVSADGYTLTLNQVVSDRHTAWMLFTVEAPDDEVLSIDSTTFEDWPVRQMQEFDGGGGYFRALADEADKPNQLRFLLTCSVKQSLAGRTVPVRWEKLTNRFYDVNGDCTGSELLAEGPWEFAVQMPERDSTVSVWQWRPITGENSEMLLTGVEVSPLSITLSCLSLRDNRYLQEGEDALQVYDRDGNVIPVVPGASWSRGFAGQLQYQFAGPVDLQDISSIVYHGSMLRW